ncbi:hypothetical protein O1L55_20715 [Streptomyces albulus]|nr:hypothetical protein [Streptomyces noursei]
MADHIDNVRVAEGGEVWVTSEIITDDDLVQMLDPNLRLPSKFINLGLIDPDGFEHGYQENDAEVIRWGSGTVANKTISREFTVKLTAMETTRDVVELFYGGSLDTNASFGTMHIDGPTNIRPEVCVVFKLQDGDVQWRLVLPVAYITDFEPPKFNAGQAVTWGMTFKAIDSYGYLAQWSSNDPDMTEPSSVPAPSIQYPREGASVAGGITVVGRGLYGAQVHVESTESTPMNVWVDDSGKWTAKLPNPPHSESVTVTAYQSYKGIQSDKTSVNFTMLGRPDTPSIKSVTPEHSRITVSWDGASVAPVESWTFSIRKHDGTADWQPVYQATTSGERFTFGLDCIEYPDGTIVDLKCVAKGPSGESDPAVAGFTSTGWLLPTPTDPIVDFREIKESWSSVDIGYPLDHYAVKIWSDGQQDYRTVVETKATNATFSIDEHLESYERIKPGTKVWLQIDCHGDDGSVMAGNQTSFTAGNFSAPKAVQITDVAETGHLVWVYPNPDPSTDYAEVNTFVYDKAKGEDTAVDLGKLDWTKEHGSAQLPDTLTVDGMTLCFFLRCKTSGQQTIDSDVSELVVIGDCNGPMLEPINSVQCRTVKVTWDAVPGMSDMKTWRVWFGSSDGKHGQPQPRDFHVVKDGIDPKATEVTFDPLSLADYQPNPGETLYVMVQGDGTDGKTWDSNYRKFTMPKRLLAPGWHGGRTMQGGMEHRKWLMDTINSYPVDHFQFKAQHPEHGWLVVGTASSDAREANIDLIRGHDKPIPLYQPTNMVISSVADDGTSVDSTYLQVTEVNCKKVYVTKCELQGTDTDKPILHVEWDYEGGGTGHSEGTDPAVDVQYRSSSGDDWSRRAPYYDNNFADLPLERRKSGQVATVNLYGRDRDDPAFDPNSMTVGSLTFEDASAAWP